MYEKKLEHGDISLQNLKFRYVGNKISGVLNDWDLATERGPTKSEVAGGGRKRTGTITYAPLDYCNPRKSPPRYRRYRHDLESFGWCLVYQCLNHQANELYLQAWHDINQSFEFRGNFLHNMADFSPREGYEELYVFAQELMETHMGQIAKRSPDAKKNRKGKSEMLPKRADALFSLGSRPAGETVQRKARTTAAPAPDILDELGDDEVWDIWFSLLTPYLDEWAAEEE